MANENTIEHIKKLMVNAPEVKAWAEDHQPDSELYYKSGVTNQAKKFSAMSDIVGVPYPRVISKHYSKSVSLPVAAYDFDYYTNCKAVVLCRDNFYDIKVCVISNAPISIPYNLIHGRMTQEQLDADKVKSINFSGGRNKDNPAYLTDEWFSTCWSHNYILRRGDEIWCAGAVQGVYCEGINKLDLPEEMYKPYQDGLSIFSISCENYAQASLVLAHINNSLSHEQHEQAEFSSRAYKV